ncbi:MAG: SPFH/Band 7/PHB domain protein [Alphaproteobacteria bacterium]|jgi:regulator of protease activity HflC (stomatin/prohibitin superfamily)|nr:SPFH/Band 7/PHB domain protein [Alphaproteobacteria bacterium]
MEPTFVTILAIVVLAVLVIASGIKIVPQSQTYVIERFGKYRSTLNAGLNLIVPFLDKVAHKVDILERRLPEHPSDVITKDNVLTNVTTSTFYRVRSPEYTVYRIQDIDGAIQTAVTGVVRSTIGISEFDEVQSNRSQLNEKLRSELIEIADEWGIEITRCEIIDVNVDAATREAMQKQLNAERERRATVTRAEGDRRAVELNADAELYAAQKQAEAVRVQAEAEAYATETIAKAIAAGGLDAIKYEMLKRQVEAVGQVSASPNAKFIVLPSDMTEAFKDVGRMFGPRGG